ncbi:glycosyltransferase family A protein [Mycobacterium sp. AMU20-3851]|uniref:glycosyltransferase family 2 protein n=1 Tax=Mycobacterium sp. AMU20-3851 TaxID=3122055 RepID=UPI003753F108
MNVAPSHTVVKRIGAAAPTVSVIVPAYRVRATLREAVDSLLRQTFRNLEVLVIDDACPDQCTEVLFGIDDSRLGIFRLQRNAGLVGARNAALALSRAPFVALLDGDDVSRPNRIARQIAAFEGRPDVGLVGCLVNGIDMQSRLITRGIDDWGLDDEALKPLMLFANPFPSAVHMLRRSAIPEGGFRPIYAEDYAMAADVARHHAVVLVREALVDYRKSPGGIMHTKFDQVSRDTLLIQGRLLREVGMGKAECDPLLMSALMHCSAQPPGALSVERMLALRQWMQDLERANAHSGRYSSDALARAIARAWELVLLHATRVEGLRFGRRYALDLLAYRAAQGRYPVRARAGAHAVLNTCRRLPVTVRSANRECST